MHFGRVHHYQITASKHWLSKLLENKQKKKYKTKRNLRQLTSNRPQMPTNENGHHETTLDNSNNSIITVTISDDSSTENLSIPNFSDDDYDTDDHEDQPRPSTSSTNLAPSTSSTDPPSVQNNSSTDPPSVPNTSNTDSPSAPSTLSTDPPLVPCTISNVIKEWKEISFSKDQKEKETFEKEINQLEAEVENIDSEIIKLTSTINDLTSQKKKLESDKQKRQKKITELYSKVKNLDDHMSETKALQEAFDNHCKKN